MPEATEQTSVIDDDHFTYEGGMRQCISQFASNACHDLRAVVSRAIDLEELDEGGFGAEAVHWQIEELARWCREFNREKQEQAAAITRLEGEREALREALSAAERDIREWLQLARRQAAEMPNADYNPLAPTTVGIKASEAVLQKILHVNIHGEVEARDA